MTTTTAPTAPTNEKKFQHYAYAKAATQMITPKGKKFSFVKGAFITDDVEIIDFLDECIADGMKEIVKGALLTAKDADPMRAIKDAAIAEYKAEQAEAAKNAALGITRNLGDTEAGAATKNLGAVSSAGVPSGVSSTAGKSSASGK